MGVEKDRKMQSIQLVMIALATVLCAMSINLKSYASFIDIAGNFVFLSPGGTEKIVAYGSPEKGAKITVSSSNSKIVKLLDKSFADEYIKVKGLKSGTATIAIRQTIKKKTKVTKIKVLVSKYVQYQLMSDTDYEGNSVRPYPKIKVKNNTVIFTGGPRYFDSSNGKVKKLKSKTRKFKLAKNAYIGGSFGMGYYGYSVRSAQGKDYLKIYKKGWTLDEACVFVAVENNKVVYLFNAME